LRLKGYDYSQSGAYFVTIVTKKRETQFGDIMNGEMVGNTEPPMDISTPDFAITSTKKPTTLSEIVRAFKSFSSRRINENKNTPGIPVWQRGFHDRIIRSDKELNAIRDYIQTNPKRWEKNIARLV
jgi:putative transposase